MLANNILAGDIIVVYLTDSNNYKIAIFELKIVKNGVYPDFPNNLDFKS